MTQTVNPEDTLVTRMLTFDGNFDGYPSMTCSDEGLIFDAYKHTHPNDSDAIVYLSFLASLHVETKEQYANAKSFIRAFVDTCWEANMSEGGNEIHEELSEEE